MKSINKLGTIIAKILEVFHWVGTGLIAAATVCALAAPDWVTKFVDLDIKESGTELSVYGFEVCASLTDGKTNMTAFFLFGIVAVVILAMMALVFRNLHGILKTSQDTTPFQQDNILRLKTIGILSMAVPVIGLLMSIILRLILGEDTTEISISQSGIFTGIILLCLTQYFVHGAQLEQDVDGLV